MTKWPPTNSVPVSSPSFPAVRGNVSQKLVDFVRYLVSFHHNAGHRRTFSRSAYQTNKSGKFLASSPAIRGRDGFLPA